MRGKEKFPFSIVINKWVELQQGAKGYDMSILGDFEARFPGGFLFIFAITYS